MISLLNSRVVRRHRRPAVAAIDHSPTDASKVGTLAFAVVCGVAAVFAAAAAAAAPPTSRR